MKASSKKPDLVGQRFGDWEIIAFAGLYRDTSEMQVRCICHGCSQSYDVRLSNLKRGVSRACKSCSARRAKRRPVKCLGSGVVYESLRDAASSEGVSLDALKMALRGADTSRVAKLRSGHRFQLEE